MCSLLQMLGSITSVLMLPSCADQCSAKRHVEIMIVLASAPRAKIDQSLVMMIDSLRNSYDCDNGAPSLSQNVALTCNPTIHTPPRKISNPAYSYAMPHLEPSCMKF
jgi:hypothetical protein